MPQHRQILQRLLDARIIYDGGIVIVAIRLVGGRVVARIVLAAAFEEESLCQSTWPVEPLDALLDKGLFAADRRVVAALVVR